MSYCSQISRSNVVKTLRLDAASLQDGHFTALLDTLSSETDFNQERPPDTDRDLALYVTNMRLRAPHVAALSAVLHRTTVLDISGCQITDSLLRQLLTHVASWNRIQKLLLDQIPLSTAAVTCLHEWLLLGDACSVHQLSLQSCGLSTRNGGDVFILQASCAVLGIGAQPLTPVCYGLGPSGAGPLPLPTTTRPGGHAPHSPTCLHARVCLARVWPCECGPE